MAMDEASAARAAEALKRALGEVLPAILEDFSVAERADAVSAFEPSHDDCYVRDDVDAAREEGRAECELAWQLLALMGLSRRECELMFVGPFEGDGVMVCPEDLLRHVRRMPAFAEFVMREAARMRADSVPAFTENPSPVSPSNVVDFRKLLQRSRAQRELTVVPPDADMSELRASEFGNKIADGNSFGGQMVSVAGNGGRIVGGGGVPLADDAPPDIPEELLDEEPPEIPDLHIPDLNEDVGDDLDEWLRSNGSARPLSPAAVSKIQWTEEQLAALDAIDEWYDGGDPFFALTGPAGSGKSSIVNEICRRHYSATLAAMTGKAALRLAACAERDATTLHKILYWPPNPGEDLRFTRLREPESEFYIVDESSLMSPTVFKHLQQWTEGGVRILLVGDSFQLPPVITGEEARDYGEDFSVFSKVDGVALETVMRSAGGVLRAAKKVRETGEICKESDEGYEYLRSQTPMMDAVNAYLADPDDHMVITWRNTIRMAANKIIRERLGHAGPLPDEGERVLLKKNGQGFMNGEIVECKTFKTGPIIGDMRTLWMTTKDGQDVLVSFDGGKDGERMDGRQPWVESWKKYHADLTKKALPEPIPISWAYVITCHCAQGQESRRVTVFLDRGDAKNRAFRKMTTLPGGRQVTFACRWGYTSATRSRNRSTMIVGR
jgi:hypothetical protein